LGITFRAYTRGTRVHDSIVIFRKVRVNDCEAMLFRLAF